MGGFSFGGVSTKHISKYELKNGDEFSVPFITDENKKPKIYSYLPMHQGELSPIHYKKPSHKIRLPFPSFISKGQIEPLKIKIANDGKIATFKVKDNQVTINQNDLTLTVTSKSGHLETYNLSDIFGNKPSDIFTKSQRNDFGNGQSVTLNLSDSESVKLDLKPTSDGKSIESATINWSDDPKLTPKQQRQLLMRQHSHNEVTISNLSSNTNKPLNISAVKYIDSSSHIALL